MKTVRRFSSLPMQQAVKQVTPFVVRKASRTRPCSSDACFDRITDNAGGPKQRADLNVSFAQQGDYQTTGR